MLVRELYPPIESSAFHEPAGPSFGSTCVLLFELEPAATPLFSAPSTLFKTRPPQTIDSRALSHSLQNNGGYTPIHPISELAHERHSPSQNRHSPVTPCISPNSPCRLSAPSLFWPRQAVLREAAMVQAMAKRTTKTQIGLALIALGTVMILANVSVVANFFATLDAQTI